MTSRRRGRPDRANEDQGLFATEYVAEEYGLEVDTESAEWYDAVHPRTGTKYEVKSTHRTLDDGSTGRFRLWADQHRSLLSSNATGTAWYAFVVLDARGNVDELRRMRPTTVTGLVDDWNLAGHSERDGRQHKVPWTEVIA